METVALAELNGISPEAQELLVQLAQPAQTATPRALATETPEALVVVEPSRPAQLYPAAEVAARMESRSRVPELRRGQWLGREPAEEELTASLEFMQ